MLPTTQAKTIEQLRVRIKEVIELTLESEDKIAKAKAKHPMASPRFFGVEDITVNFA